MREGERDIAVGRRRCSGRLSVPERLRCHGAEDRPVIIGGQHLHKYNSRWPSANNRTSAGA